MLSAMVCFTRSYLDIQEEVRVVFGFLRCLIEADELVVEVSQNVEAVLDVFENGVTPLQLYPEAHFGPFLGCKIISFLFGVLL